MNKSEVEYKIPQGVIIIEKDAFMMCASLQNINIPNSVKYICYRPNSI